MICENLNLAAVGSPPLRENPGALWGGVGGSTNGGRDDDIDDGGSG